MDKNKQKILFLGSCVKITNLPTKEVSLLEEGSLPTAIIPVMTLICWLGRCPLKRVDWNSA